MHVRRVDSCIFKVGSLQYASIAFFDRWLSNSRSGHNVIARSRIQTGSENSEIGNGIEIEFSNQFRLNPGDANMSFQLLIHPDSDEET